MRVVPWLTLLVLLVGGTRSMAQPTPRVTITHPTEAATHTTTTSPVVVAGTARDNRGVVRVTWTNDRGGTGVD